MSDRFDIKNLSGLSVDSRAVKPGYLFAALAGTQADGARYIEEAIEKGAVAILTGEDFKGNAPESKGKISFIHDRNPRRRFAKMAAEFYDRQPRYIAAVTGTNGKTSVVHFARQLWTGLNIKASSIGTLGVDGKGGASMTTPDPAALHKTLADLEAAGVTHVAMEASSHGLDQYRMDGVHVSAAAFTNLTQDHLDYHGGMDIYFNTKQRLFSELLSAGGTAVLNADTPYFKKLETICHERDVGVLSFGFQGHDLKIVSLEPDARGQKLQLKILDKIFDVIFPLPGAFQVSNALCALGLVLAEKNPGLSPEKLVPLLQDLKGVPGRLQAVPGHPQGAGIYIDYAHTPDALENVLQALRPHAAGRLICVFGCGGDRDKTKRPLMGAIAARLADRVIVTDDNPRSEEPAAIRSDILQAAPDAKEIGDRAQAIAMAIAELEKGDVLLIAGKGHEQGQIFKDSTHPFDDYEQATLALEDLQS